MISSILDETYRQSQGASMSEDVFICQTCQNYGGRCRCAIGVFIAFEGANMICCQFHEYGRKCPHCGRRS